MPRHVLGKGFLAPSDKINLAFIGLGKQSRGLAVNAIKNNAEIIACSDVWTTKNEWFKDHVAKNHSEIWGTARKNSVQSFRNYLEMLEHDAIDGVVVASPDHWHARHVMDSLRADKDVYCEKPLSHNIVEGRKMVKAVNKAQAVLQVGSMQRSRENFRRACELVRNGYLGTIRKVEVNVGDPARPYDLKGEEVPAEVDWNHWCGPAPLLAYNHRLSPASNDVKFWPDWRLFQETGGRDPVGLGRPYVRYCTVGARYGPYWARRIAPSFGCRCRSRFENVLCQWCRGGAQGLWTGLGRALFRK